MDSIFINLFMLNINQLNENTIKKLKLNFKKLINFTAAIKLQKVHLHSLNNTYNEQTAN